MMSLGRSEIMGPNSPVAELTYFYDREISPTAKGNMAEHINNFFFLTRNDDNSFRNRDHDVELKSSRNEGN